MFHGNIEPGNMHTLFVLISLMACSMALSSVSLSSMSTVYTWGSPINSSAYGC